MTINQNSILKLVVRQGTDLERKQVILTSGELGYSTDTKRLFVGDSVLSGGKVVGNISHDTNSTIPSNYPTAVKGDIAFASDSSKLYRFTGTNANDLSSWEVIGGVYTSNSPYILISSDNELTLAPLSANSISNDAIQFPLISNAGKITLSATIPTSYVSTKTITVSSGLKSTSNGSSTTNTPVNPLDSNIIIESNQILAMYNGTTNTLSYSRNLGGTPVTRLSAGHYRFIYNTLPTSSIYPLVNIFGPTPINCASRVISVTTTSCDVQIFNASGPAVTDAIVTLNISY